MKNLKHTYGQALIELLIAMALTAIIMPAVITGIAGSRQGKVQQEQRLEAVNLAREAREALRTIRDSGWDNVSTNGTFHPVATTSAWMLVPGTEQINGLTRSVVIGDTYRDATGKITLAGGTLDPSTKSIVITVSWDSFFPTSVTSTFYLARFENLAYIQTTVADFNAGTNSGTTVTNTNGGEVTLGAGGGADWCSPNLSITALDLPKNGVANGITAIEGKVFAGTGDNASGVSFANVTIGNINPPTATVSGTFDGYKTNGVFGESNYAYLATDTNNKEIEIVDLTNYNPVTGKYAEAGYFDAPVNGNGNSVVVSGTTGYMTDSTNLYNFNLTSKSGSRPAIDPDGVTLAGTGKQVVVVGNYAYIAIDSTTTQMQIVDISSPTSLTVVGQAQLNAQGGLNVYVNATGTRAYLATRTSATQPEMFIIDVTTKTGNHTALGSYETGGMSPKGITVVPGNRAIVVGTGGSFQYQVVDISTETNPVLCTSGGRTGGLSIPTGVNGIASLVETDGDAFSYIITGDATSELKIIAGGPGGQAANTGTFESSIFNASKSATFNRFMANGINPSQTTTRYQVAVAQAVSGACTGAAYSFVGPDMTGGTFFATSSAIPLGISGNFVNPGQCMKYRVYLSTLDPGFSPVLYDITFNYSP